MGMLIYNALGEEQWQKDTLKNLLTEAGHTVSVETVKETLKPIHYKFIVDDKEFKFSSDDLKYIGDEIFQSFKIQSLDKNVLDLIMGYYGEDATITDSTGVTPYEFETRFYFHDNPIEQE